MYKNDPRKVAHSLLVKAEQNGTYSNIALDRALSDSDMSREDKNLAATLFYGVTERKLTLDYHIKKYSSRPVEEIDTATLSALRMGLYQLIYLDRIPPHAALSETVDLVSRKTSGFVNAILRAYTRAPDLSLPEKTLGERYLSVAYSVGLPLVRKLIDTFGAEEAEKLLEAYSVTPPTTLRTNTLMISRDELMKKVGGTPTPISQNGIYVKGSPRELYGFGEGYFFVQDEASQICVDVLDAQAGDTVMDICSCPGSKSFGAAISMGDRGELFAFDLHENKLSLVRSGAERLGIHILQARAADGRVPLPEFSERADRVLCDVPCSGFGVLGKKPELRYKDPAESERLPDIQLAILKNAANYLKRGGTLVYSTCTVFPEENEQNIRRFLAEREDFTLCPFSVGSGDNTLTCPEGYITLSPAKHGTDGFFIAKMKRK